ncbi:Dehydration-responsive element-binding protein 1E [Capsicum annuum]|uniref:Dehydration-responsive element-binding protein 1E n=1 Tax=Capsicum annuum TaxID=4072 RepID=A0A1U8FGE9_CAPAN|nr:Dehydration-responsive element-binding protein 1E [Capsicum annuum]
MNNNNNNLISYFADFSMANLERDHSQKTSSSSSEKSGGGLLLAANRPKKRAGRKKFKETRHPIYRGVRRRNNNKWVCEIREPSEQKRIWLGTYPTPEMAARAHDVVALALRGNLATLNFEDSSWRLSVPVSKDPKELRQAAIKAANAFHQDSYKSVGIDYMNQEVNSDDVVGGGASGGDKYNIQNMDILCCNNWGENNEMLEIEGLSWQEKMAEGLLFSPTPRLGSCFSWDDVESDVEVSLWSYDI